MPCSGRAALILLAASATACSIAPIPLYTQQQPAVESHAGRVVSGSAPVPRELSAELAARANEAYRNAWNIHLARDSVQDRLIQLLLGIAEQEHCARTDPSCRSRMQAADTMWRTARTLKDRADTLGVHSERERENGDSLAAAYRVAIQVAAQHTSSMRSLSQSLQQRAASGAGAEDVDSTSMTTLTEIAVRFRIVGRPRFISRPHDGGVVLFQTFRARERNDPPQSLPETTNTRPQEIPIGCYYFWVQRGSNDTSDRNRAICVTQQTQEIILDETSEGAN